MLIARRNLMGGVKLPYDAEVEWIEISNRESITVPVNPHFTDKTVFVIKGRLIYGVSQFIRWAKSSWSEYNVVRFFNVDDIYTRLGYLNSGLVFTPKIVGDFHVEIGNLYVKDLNTGTILAKSGTTTWTEPPGMEEHWNPIFGAEGGAGTRISSLLVKEAGVVVYDLITVRITNENGVSEGAMYDRVSGQLFRNEGTGAFVIGPDKTT